MNAKKKLPLLFRQGNCFEPALSLLRGLHNRVTALRDKPRYPYTLMSFKAHVGVGLRLSAFSRVFREARNRIEIIANDLSPGAMGNFIRVIRRRWVAWTGKKLAFPTW